MLGRPEGAPLDVLVGLVEHVRPDQRRFALGVIRDDRPVARNDGAGLGCAPVTAQAVEVDVVPDPARGQEAVGDARSAIDGRLGHATQVQVRNVLRCRRDAHITDLEALALEVDGLARPGLADDRHRLLDQARALLQFTPELCELVGAVADADAKVEAPAGEQRQRCRVLGDTHRVVQGQDHQVGADAHALGARTDGSGDHQRRGCVAVGAEMVFREPHRVEAQHFCLGNLVQRVGIHLLKGHRPGGGVAEVVPEAEIHMACHGVGSAAQAMVARKSSRTWR